MVQPLVKLQFKNKKQVFILKITNLIRSWVLFILITALMFRKINYKSIRTKLNILISNKFCFIEIIRKNIIEDNESSTTH